MAFVLYVVLIKGSKKYLQYFCVNNSLDYYHRTAMFLFVHVANSYYCHLQAHVCLYLPLSFEPSTRFIHPLSNLSFIHLIIHPSIRPSTYSSIHQLICLFINASIQLWFINPLIRLVIIYPSIHSFIRVFIYLFIHPSIYPSIQSSIQVSVHLSTNSSVCSPIYLSSYLFIHPLNHLYIHPSIRVCIDSFIRVSINPFTNASLYSSFHYSAIYSSIH